MEEGSGQRKEELFHVIHKVPQGDTPYVKAKHAQLVQKDPEAAIVWFWKAINAGDRVDSALKDMAVVMKQLDRTEEAIEAIKSFRGRCSKKAQDSLDNVLIDLYKGSTSVYPYVKISHVTREDDRAGATMGYLHEGHLSLVEEAHKHAEVIVVSVYVNPGPFSPSEDLSTYPSDFHGDILNLKSAPGGVDAVFAPKNLYDYRENKKSEIMLIWKIRILTRKGWFHVWRRGEWGTKQGLELRDWREDILCGKNRPVFFRGVATIVTKLFNIVEPDVAVFGKKDYHQWRIIQRMVRDPDFGTEIVGSDIVRDSDGLALSSRNVHLSPEEREKALSINRSLLRAKSDAKIGLVNCKELTDAVIVKQGSLEAVEGIKNPVVFCIAAWFGKVRLIDNIEISI
ncbi:hypothetical protein SLEP1_g686 [Rubroshorea leprosula]|uniref:Pantoate--beta-alanine ligase n=1 Tax=Rubroshorea leprosula TaxID=152421 RepID=A0AAV5HBB8_9ROSI|nr:hypothetical protein SLEP1_g686 [Rubroshorea leprosula]